MKVKVWFLQRQRKEIKAKRVEVACKGKSVLLPEEASPMIRRIDAGSNECCEKIIDWNKLSCVRFCSTPHYPQSQDFWASDSWTHVPIHLITWKKRRI